MSPQSPLKVPSPSTAGHAGSFATLSSGPSIWKVLRLLYPKTVAYKSRSSGETDIQQSSATAPRLVLIGTTLSTPILPSSSMRHMLTPSPTAYARMKVSGRLCRGRAHSKRRTLVCRLDQTPREWVTLPQHHPKPPLVGLLGHVTFADAASGPGLDVER